MNKNFWENTWDNMEVGFDQEQYNQDLISFISPPILAEKSVVFVPLCGKTIDMIWLQKKHYQVIGVEWCQKACEMFFTQHQIPYSVTKQKAFQIFKSKNITLFCGDFFDLQPSGLEPFSFVYDRAALIALPGNMRKKYVQHLYTLMRNPVKILLITVCYDQNSMQGPPFAVCEKEVYNLYKNNFKIQCLKNEDLAPIALHLQAKGLQCAKTQVYFLESLKTSKDPVQ